MEILQRPSGLREVDEEVEEEAWVDGDGGIMAGGSGLDDESGVAGDVGLGNEDGLAMDVDADLLVWDAGPASDGWR
jgi:hypothetical protein